MNEASKELLKKNQRWEISHEEFVSYSSFFDKIGKEP
jgi:hypothetical protein